VSPRRVLGLPELRRHAIARSLFEPTSLTRAVARLGYVQADPMRAPARAQDLILGERVEGYRAGDLERRYPRLAIEEAFFVNYGFVPRRTLVLLHPREAPREWDSRMERRAADVLAFVRERAEVRARDVEAEFDHGRMRRWGGDLRVTSHILEGLHYRGLLRVARREAGTRVYQALRIADAPAVDAPTEVRSPEARLARAARLLDTVVRLYAPLPAASLGYLSGLMRRYGAPQLAAELGQIREQAGSRYANARVDGQLWFWPRGENPGAAGHEVGETVRFLSPFDPVVWDRRRFHSLWGWEYKFEAYLPADQRRMGHYAMPVLWREHVVGWANLKVVDGRLRHSLGFVGPRPRGLAFRRALDEALRRMAVFLGLSRS
jgi:uncharacterized protein